ncbi:hypothetical protein [Pseudobutyrivibrio xylanivorans]|uniref:Uncharacterized protein n=1 Tax=Pseudobutyrivibrio xylanivorans TaxID=185007 RepID=A0A1G5S6Y5_PSEXY|nr:hypothetical protein [Pseudobutyrivibrio xylanivorans]SCZ81329.1 hypothetical protein SAMN02910350_02762 [Pseudobutyrivibrio xylanivorans]
MKEYILYLIVIISVVVAFLTIYFAVKNYRKKKRVLEDEIDNAYEQLHKAEVEAKNNIDEMERLARRRINTAEAELQRKTDELNNRLNEFNNRVNQFNKEQALRESLEGKSDRDVIVEMHVKAERISESLNIIENKLVGVRDYSNKLSCLENNLSVTFNELENFLKESVSEMQGKLQESFDELDYSIRDTISENMKSLDEEDMRNAVSQALDYDSYSFVSKIEDSVQEAIRSELDSKLNELDSKFDDFDWKLNNIESKFDTYN